MKTPEELNALKAEVEALNGRLAELSEDELAVVLGGERDFTYEITFDDQFKPRNSDTQ